MDRAPPTTLHGRGKYGAPRQEWEKSVGGPMNAPAEEAEAHAKVSKRENRLYVGNLAYDCNYKDLEAFIKPGTPISEKRKDLGDGGDHGDPDDPTTSHIFHLRIHYLLRLIAVIATSSFVYGAGEVVFAEILTTPQGTSKGCGIVEFATQEDARRAKDELADKPFMGRSVFIREDREETARFGTVSHAGTRPPFVGGAGGHHGGFQAAPNPANRNLFVGNLPLQASWQDLKDLMRQSGEVIRADIGMSHDGQPKGNGTVVFVNPDDARAAIEMFNGFDWFGSILEVREDRHAGHGHGAGGFGFRGGFRGGFMGARGGFGPGFRGGFAPGFRGGFAPGFRGGFAPGFRGGFRGGFQGGAGAGAGFQGGAAAGAGGRAFTNDLYADYNGPAGGAGANGAAGAGGMEVEGAPSGPAGGVPVVPAEPNQQILVRNLPWSTSNEDLVELFETVGVVAFAEMLYEGTRSKGEGIVQFGQTEEAQTASERFTGYLYGGRPLGVQFNPRWHDFTSAAAAGNQSAAA
ncbi:uncharacterized protein MKK02DRAFT_31135 [Dioszegia hungarica]|uniref:RRM domain-containing protein n=1 Tax=Dioszegia hungarica TaxID=4972 RepID=A0AA38HD03_9TREE|nr:uncharacterized protein MKK02DRAFT_31135 [Dioszegia hungarica]KAI9638822.1 hypothetical protein MKK02DRAFT_31135 [Dioszegia hungarica]